MSRYPFRGVETEGENSPPKVLICWKFGHRSFRFLCFLLSGQWIWLTFILQKKNKNFTSKKTSCFTIR